MPRRAVVTILIAILLAALVQSGEPNQLAGTPSEAEKRFTGVWTGGYPGGVLRVVLSIQKSNDAWSVEAFLLTADGQQVGHFKQQGELAGKELRVVPRWTRRPDGVPPSIGYVIAERSSVMRLEIWMGNLRKAAADLKRGDESLLAGLTKAASPEVSKDKDKDKDKAMNAGGLIQGLGFLADGKTLALGMSDGSLQYWDVGKRERTKSIPAKLAVSSVAVSANGELLARAHSNTLGKGEGIIQLFDAATGKETRTLEGHATVPTNMAFSSDGRWLISADVAETPDRPPGTVKVWDTSSAKTVASLKVIGHALAFSPSGKRFALATSQGVPAVRLIHVCDTNGGKVLATLGGGHKNLIRRCAFSPDGNMLASVGDDGFLVIWSLKSGKIVAGAQLGAKTGGRLDAVAYSPDGATIVVGQQEGFVYYRDAKTAKEIKTERPFRDNVGHLVYSRDRKLAIGTADPFNGRILLVE